MSRFLSNIFTIGDKNNEKDLFKTAEAMTKELEEKIKSKLEELT